MKECMKKEKKKNKSRVASPGLKNKMFLVTSALICY